MITQPIKIHKTFITQLSETKRALGRLDDLETLIQLSCIPEDSKEILIWRYCRLFFIKQIGTMLQKKLNLVQPLSDRQVSRRLDNACELLYSRILETLGTSTSCQPLCI